MLSPASYLVASSGSGTLVIGLGNPLMTDDGVGLVALERLRADRRLPSDAVLVDGGTWGLRLLPDIEDAARLLLLDAIDVGGRSGEVIVLERDDIPRYLRCELSPHQVGLRDVLALADLRGSLPRETVAMGIQPTRVELGDAVSPASLASLDELVERAVVRLERWHRESSPAGDDRVGDGAEGDFPCTR